MITIRSSYLIVSIRLIIYIVTFLTTKVLAVFFDSAVNTDLFISIGLLVTFFSLLTLFTVRIFSPVVIFYIQAFFDTLITSFLIVNTGYLDSPYIVFFAVIMIYMGFYEGFKGGVIGLLLVIIFFSFLGIVKNELFVSQYYNFKYLMLITEYVLSFLLVIFLVSFLNKKYRNKIKESEEFKNKLQFLSNLHQAILENVDFGVILVGNDNRIISLNGAAKRILEISDDVIGKNLDDILPFPVIEGTLVFAGKHIGFKKKEFYSLDGELSGNLIIFQDISEKEQLKAKLEEEKRLAELGKFSSIIAHEIKNPLGAIKGAIQIISKTIQGDERILRILDREINRLDLFLGNMLILTKNNKHDTGYVKIRELIEEFIFYINTTNILEGLKIKNDVDDFFVLNMLEGELRQILWNLFINSYEAKNDALVRIYNTNSQLIYEDNGPGIKEIYINQIGKPFFTTKNTGTGLGFYTISKICEQRGVNYKVYSNREFQGFKIEFMPQ